MASNYGEASKKDKNPLKVSYLVEPRKESSYIPQAPFAVLNMYGGQVKRLRTGKLIRPIQETNIGFSTCQLLSADSMVNFAKLRLLDQSSKDFRSSASLHFRHSVSCDCLKDVKSICLLLNAAEMLSKKQFDSAEKVLRKCILVSSFRDNYIERVVQYFGEALRERADIERGKIDIERKTSSICDTMQRFHPAALAAEQKLPCTQITQFTAIQAILEIVASAKKIHLIDFGIKSGMHWSVMMQGLANPRNCTLELLKITAVGNSKDRLEKTGKFLSSFSESMGLPLLYKPVVSEFKNVRKDLFDLERDEVVTVYASVCLWSQLVTPTSLKDFMKCIKELEPCLMMVNEYEASTNMPSFIDRFHGGLVFSMAIFDCLETCLKGDPLYWKAIEEVFLSTAIRNIVTAEDEERIFRHAKIDFWRNLFAEFDMVEMELSDICKYQAKLLVKSNSCWDCCTLDMEGKCLIVGWKGSPLQSISAWKINSELKHTTA